MGIETKEVLVDPTFYHSFLSYRSLTNESRISGLCNPVHSGRQRSNVSPVTDEYQLIGGRLGGQKYIN